MHCWKHGIDDLFKRVIQIGLTFLGVSPDTVLDGVVDTCIRSSRRLIRSISGSSAATFFSSSPKVKAC